MAEINLLVNGIHHSLQVKDNATLLQVLHDRLGLTGAGFVSQSRFSKKR